MAFRKVTEMDGPHRHLEQKPVLELMELMNVEDQLVAFRVKEAIPQIALFAEAVTDRMLAGGRLFYIGAGTSGRIAILDATECPPTFGVPTNLVNGIIAGGKKALYEAVEFAEDDRNQGWNDLLEAGISLHDVVLGISASGSAPYVLHALESCGKAGICTGSLSCNPDAPVSALADIAIEVVVGPEFITGSTRLKAGTAQKMVLNMISTSVMIQLGRVEDNKMVHMKLSNEKLINRGTALVMKLLKISDEKEARNLLLQAGTVKAALKNYHL